MAWRPGRKALADAGIAYDEIEQAYVGYVYGDSICGQRALYELGLTGIPVVQREQRLRDGLLGAAVRWQRGDQVRPGRLRARARLREDAEGLAGRRPSCDRHHADGPHIWTRCWPSCTVRGRAADARRCSATPDASTWSATARPPSTSPWIGYKNHKHSVNNPYAQFQTEYSLDEILDAPMIHAPLTKLQCSPDLRRRRLRRSSVGARSSRSTACGTRRSRSPGRRWPPTPRRPSTTSARSDLVGSPDVARRGAPRPSTSRGPRTEDVDVIELHDCFSANELITYEALGLCAEGEGASWWTQATTYGGRWVVNPSGGLISKGHPLGATGLAQCSELTWQLRGQADKRQVEGADVALQHNIGLGGACVVSVYKQPA